MNNTEDISISNLSIDLENFRTVRKESEVEAIRAMISISPDRFWALAENLLGGYLPTENIIVLNRANENLGLIVKEGNRRVAAMKIIHGTVDPRNFDIPNNILLEVKRITSEGDVPIATVPCVVYDDPNDVDKIVALIHGKGEKAAREEWKAVARARHSRDAGLVPQPPLDLLEKYLECGTNLSSEQAKRWSGDYPLTVLEEALKKLFAEMGAANPADLCQRYPQIPHKPILDKILMDIGLNILGFNKIRDKHNDFRKHYGLHDPPAILQTQQLESDKQRNALVLDSTGAPTLEPDNRDPSAFAPTMRANSVPVQAVSPAVSSPKKRLALATNDPKNIETHLKKFKPKGENREKLVLLLVEARKLRIAETPIAFCFLLRSMFEISAKAYCDDYASQNGPSLVRSNGDQRHLKDILSEISKHIEDRSKDKDIKKLLHGAGTELSKDEGILSVASMNNLIHNASFAVTASEISVMFSKIFPLLEQMNQ